MMRGAVTGGLATVDTGFDFLEGAFARAERTRRAMIGVTLATAAVLTGLMLVTVQATLVLASDSQALAAARQATATATDELNRVDVVDGYPASLLRTHVSARTDVLTVAVRDELDLATVSAVYAAAPPGMTVTGVSVTWPGGSGALPTPGAAGTVTGSATPTAATGPTLRMVRVTATTPDFATLSGFQQALSRVPGFGQVTPTWSGGAGNWQVTASTTLSGDAVSTRAAAVATSTGSGVR